MKQEPYWGGSLTGLTDDFGYGTYRFRIIDQESDSLIYSKGFSTLFQEWQTTPEAKQTEKTFYHCLIFPYPRNLFKLCIDARQWTGDFKTIFETDIDPTGYFILKEPSASHEIKSIIENGSPDEKIDLVILPEGYRQEEMTKFLDDSRRMIDYLFDQEPFVSARHQFNVKAVLTPSLNSGTDIPGEGIYKNTYYNSTFYTFDIDRYLTTTDMKAIHDAAACVPYDHIYVLVNTNRYGGGGIYNFLNICTAGNEFSEEVFVHEFGHGFAGLGDEYYTSAVAYEAFYNVEEEPWEPNLTTLVDFTSKWASMVHDSVPVPTPREKMYQHSVGAFEGGGYQEKGIYSPFMDCRMKSNEARTFCPVCKDAIQRKIDFYSK